MVQTSGDRLLLVSPGRRVEVATPSICKIGRDLGYERSRSGLKCSLERSGWDSLLISCVTLSGLLNTTFSVGK